ncbi:head decoration protein [Hoeflea sp.]|uniref:head decoration protein n=1 Tax=Hoeflea sp. TaxID=1940281 RepID=UPI003B51DA3E
MTMLTEGRHPGEFIMTEANGQRSREALTIAESQTIQPGGLLAKLLVAAGATVSVADGDGDHTGKGDLTLADPAINGRAKDGVYTVVCTAAATNGGSFEVSDPAGKPVGVATVGTAFNKEVKFTIADGGTDFAVGDSFNITVVTEDSDFQYVAYDQDGTDGSEIPSAIAIYGAVTGASETVKIAGLVRDCEINAHCIEWPDDITEAEKVDAIQSLNDSGIIVRA